MWRVLVSTLGVVQADFQLRVHKCGGCESDRGNGVLYGAAAEHWPFENSALHKHSPSQAALLKQVKRTWVGRGFWTWGIPCL